MRVKRNKICRYRKGVRLALERAEFLALLTPREFPEACRLSFCPSDMILGGRTLTASDVNDRFFTPLCDIKTSADAA